MEEHPTVYMKHDHSGQRSTAIGLAAGLVLAYLTDWLGLLLNRLAELYDLLWTRQRRKAEKPGRRKSGRHLRRRP